MASAIEDTICLCSGEVELRLSEKSGKIVDISTQKSGSLLVPAPHDRGDEVPRGGPNLFDCFDITRAWGFDECYPTVSGFPNFGLRDHGWIWGCRPKVSLQPLSVLCEWELSSGGLFRRLVTAESLSAAELGAFRFEVEFPVRFQCANGLQRLSANCVGLYAAHALFSVDAGDELHIRDGLPGESSTVVWQRVFPDATCREAQKFYVSGKGPLHARLLRKKHGVEIRVECSEQLNHLGIWWCNNGWGDGREHRTVGIEPTSHPSDGPLFTSLSDLHHEAGVHRVSFCLRVLCEKAKC